MQVQELALGRIRFVGDECVGNVNVSSGMSARSKNIGAMMTSSISPMSCGSCEQREQEPSFNSNDWTGLFFVGIAFPVLYVSFYLCFLQCRGAHIDYVSLLACTVYLSLRRSSILRAIRRIQRL